MVRDRIGERFTRIEQPCCDPSQGIYWLFEANLAEYWLRLYEVCVDQIEQIWAYLVIFVGQQGIFVSKCAQGSISNLSRLSNLLRGLMSIFDATHLS